MGKFAKTFAIANRKGGCGKTMTAVSLAAGLAQNGKRVLCIDADSQGSLSVSLGVAEPDKLTATLATALMNIVNEQDYEPLTGVIHHSEGIDLMSANSNLAALEISLAGIIGRETVLRQYIDTVKPLYDFIIIDTAPTLDLLTKHSLYESWQDSDKFSEWQGGEVQDSCWGFLGDFDDVLKNIAEHLPQNAKYLAQNAEYGACKVAEPKKDLLGRVGKAQSKVDAQSAPAHNQDRKKSAETLD